MLQLLAVLFLSCLAIQPIDVHPLLFGPGATPSHQSGELAYETFDDVLMVDLSLVDLMEDSLWEAHIRTQSATSTASNICEYSVGYTDENQIYHEIRRGSIGGNYIGNDYTEEDFGDNELDPVKRTFVITSSAVVWVRGDEIEELESATYLIYRFDKCLLGRYITRWQMEAWNGDAYVMDLASSKWFDTAVYGDDVIRVGDTRIYNLPGSSDGGFDFEDPTVSFDRDNSMYDPESNYWILGRSVDNTGDDEVSEIFDFSYHQSAFLDLTDIFATPGVTGNNPTLDLWFYGPHGQHTWFGLFLCPNDAITGEPCDANDWDTYVRDDFFNDGEGDIDLNPFTSMSYVQVGANLYYDSEFSDEEVDIAFDLLYPSAYGHLYYDIEEAWAAQVVTTGVTSDQFNPIVSLSNVALSPNLVFPPYGKVWVSGIGSESPVFVNFGPEQASVSSNDCASNSAIPFTSQKFWESNFFTHAIDDDIMPTYFCTSETGSLSFNLGSSVSGLNNPFALYTDIVDPGNIVTDTQLLYDYTITTGGATVGDFSYPGNPPFGAGGSWNDHQISLNGPSGSSTSITWDVSNDLASGVELNAFFLGSMIAFASPATQCGAQCGTGTCFEFLDGFVCQCPIDRIGECTGKYCEMELYQDCDTIAETAASVCPPDNNPCMNDGLCLQDPEDESTFKCYCSGSFHGDLCQEPTNPTLVCPQEPSPCQNGGLCQSASDGTAICTCPGGYEGYYCQYPTCSEVCEMQRDEVVGLLDNSSLMEDIVDLVGGLFGFMEIDGNTDFRTRFEHTRLIFEMQVSVQLSEDEARLAVFHWVDLLNAQLDETELEIFYFNRVDELPDEDDEDDEGEEGEEGEEEPVPVPEPTEEEEEEEAPDAPARAQPFSRDTDFYVIWVEAQVEGQTKFLQVFYADELPASSIFASVLAILMSLFILM